MIPSEDQHLTQPTTDRRRLLTFTYGDYLFNGVQAHQVTIATADDCAECAYAIAITCFDLRFVCVCSCDRFEYAFPPSVVTCVRTDLDMTVSSPCANEHILSFAVDSDKRMCGKVRVWDKAHVISVQMVSCESPQAVS